MDRESLIFIPLIPVQSKYDETRKNMTTNQRHKTATHELGHALGLDHTGGTNDIMRQGILNITSLSQTDKDSYDAAYATY